MSEVKRFKGNRHPFMWAFIVVDIVVVLLPVAVLVVQSFAQSWTYPDLLPESYSLRGFETVFSMKGNMPEIIAVSIGLSLAVAVLATVISLMAARAIALYRFAGRRLADFMSLVPLMVSATALGMGIHVFTLQRGLANNALGVILVHLLIVIPYAVKMLVDPIAIMGTNISDQARNLGAGPLRAFFDVELAPLLPSLVSTMSLSFLVSFGQYFLTLIIGGGKVMTLALVMVPWAASPDRTLAAAYALVYFVVTFVVLALFALVGRVLARNRRNYLM